MNLRLVSKVASSFIFEFAEYTDVDPSLWAEAETLILSQLSDSEPVLTQPLSSATSHCAAQEQRRRWSNSPGASGGFLELLIRSLLT